jgi:predicted AAA+ superfamily ATPase
MTIQKYIKHLCDAFILKKINYYDIRGSKIINSSPKYYATDLGILYLNHNYKYYYNFGYKLENLVLLELLNSKYEVYTHITKNKKEIDFVAIKDNKTTFIQVCETINSEEVFKREFGNLKDVGKTGKKLVLSLDNTLHNECDDIEHKNIVE